MSEFVVTINGKKKNILLTENSTVKVDDKNFHFEIKDLGELSYLLKLENKFYEVTSKRLNEERYSIVVNGSLFEIEIRTSLKEKARKLLEQKSSANHKLEIKAPMPGMILKVNKKIGDDVAADEPIIILEAMKMENELRAPSAGKIKEIFISEGAAVEKGLKLFSIES